MRKILLSTVAILALSVAPAFAGSTFSIGGGFNLSNAQTGTTAATSGLSAAGGVGTSNNQSLGAGFATASPLGGLSAGIGATTGTSAATSGAFGILGGSAVSGAAATNSGLGVGGGFTNVTP